MRQLYDLGVRGFWFTDAQFIPAKCYIQDAKDLLKEIQKEGLNDIKWAAYIRADNLDKELAELTKGIVSSDVEFIVNEASLKAALLDVKISMEIIKDVLSTFKPRLSKDDLDS